LEGFVYLGPPILVLPRAPKNTGPALG